MAHILSHIKLSTGKGEGRTVHRIPVEMLVYAQTKEMVSVYGEPDDTGNRMYLREERLKNASGVVMDATQHRFEPMEFNETPEEIDMLLESQGCLVKGVKDWGTGQICELSNEELQRQVEFWSFILETRLRDSQKGVSLESHSA